MSPATFEAAFHARQKAYLTWVFGCRGTQKKTFGMTAAELTPMAYRDQAAACHAATPCASDRR